MNTIHVALISIFQLDLRKKIVDSLAQDDHYEKIKDRLQHHNLEKILETPKGGQLFGVTLVEKLIKLFIEIYDK